MNAHNLNGGRGVFKYHLTLTTKNTEIVGGSRVVRSDILASELSEGKGERVFIDSNVVDDTLVIEIFARDSTILRAATNSIERLLVSIDKTVGLYREMRKAN